MVTKNLGDIINFEPWETSESMAGVVDFYFDFSSPYGYLAAQAVEQIGRRQGRNVIWHPFLLGPVFKVTGQQPLLNMPLKGDYARRDLARAARLLNVPFKLPARFPFASVAACRAFYWLAKQDEGRAKALAVVLYDTAFGQGGDIGSAAGVIEVAARQGIDRDGLGEALQDPEVKAHLRQEVDKAISLGVFGSPFFIVDGEPFWGHDQLSHVERWLETGGW